MRDQGWFGKPASPKKINNEAARLWVKYGPRGIHLALDRAEGRRSPRGETYDYWRRVAAQIVRREKFAASRLGRVLRRLRETLNRENAR